MTFRFECRLLTIRCRRDGPDGPRPELKRYAPWEIEMIIQLLDGMTSTERSIRLDSAAGEPIDNGQTLEISAFERNQFQDLKKWEANAAVRSDPTPRYNCHGMTFATRRTSIFSANVIRQILKEDDYVEVLEQNVLAGDVIIYFSPDGDAEHSGVVVTPPRDSLVGIARVVSKWGKYGELVHWANSSPYTCANIKYFRVLCK